MNINTKNKQTVLVQFPILDHTESIANIKLEVTSIETELITIKDAFFYGKSTSLTLINFGDETEISIIAGNAYPNSMLGDLNIQIPHGISQIVLRDLARFIKSDDSLDIKFPKNFNGCIYATSAFV